MTRHRRGWVAQRKAANLLSICANVIGALAAGGCGLLGLFQDDCGTPPVAPPSEPLSPIQLALRYLEETQLAADQVVWQQTDYAGDWPQCLAFRREGPFVRDVSPFISTFIHHALSLIVGEHREILGLRIADVESARRMRRAAAELMLRFQAGPESPDAGTFGFWPQRSGGWVPGDLLLSRIGLLVAQGPRFMGSRAPVNVSFYPRELAIQADADDTAAVYAALLDHARIDGGDEVAVRFERFFTDWRDLGQVPRANDAPWLPGKSGAYLTWLAYRGDLESLRPNDVDIVVNANMFYARGRYGRLGAAGVPEAVAIINDAIMAEAHPSDPDRLSLYYPDNLALHYCVARTYREGGVSDLKLAAELLAQDLLSSYDVSDAGHVFWNPGDPHLNTALAVSALLRAGYVGEVPADAVAYLLSEQDPNTGAWEAGVFFRGRYDSGIEAGWLSPALTTAMALEALGEHRLASFAD